MTTSPPWGVLQFSSFRSSSGESASGYRILQDHLPLLRVGQLELQELETASHQLSDEESLEAVVNALLAGTHWELSGSKLIGPARHW